MTNWFTALANAAAYYFRAKAVAASYELQRDVEHDILLMESDIEALRKKGDSESQLAADRVRARIMRAQGIAAAIEYPVPTPSPPPASRAAGPDGRW